MLVFNLYIGSIPRLPTSPPVTKDWLKQIMSPLFPSFTIQEGDGVFRGMTEHTFAVKVTPLDIIEFYHTTEAIRTQLDQDGIGVEHGRGYHRIAEGGTLTAWLEQMYPRIRPEYLSTVFKASKPTAGWPGRFAIITAWNPDGHMQNQFENERANADLENHFSKLKLNYWKVTGCSPDLLHEEVGFGVEVTLLDALTIGRHYRQEAVFWVEKNQLSVVSCVWEIEIPIGSWESKIIA